MAEMTATGTWVPDERKRAAFSATSKARRQGRVAVSITSGDNNEKGA